MTARPVTADMTATLAGAEGLPPAVLRVTFRYDPADPFAVTAAFHVGLEEPVKWVFARDLLRDGLKAPAGTGDVHVSPARTRAGIVLVLRSPFGRGEFTVPRSRVTTFLASAYRLVPEGTETVDVDAAIGGLLRREGRP